MAQQTDLQVFCLPGAKRPGFVAKEAVVDEGDDALHRSQLGSDFRRERQLTDNGRM